MVARSASSSFRSARLSSSVSPIASLCVRATNPTRLASTTRENANLAAPTSREAGVHFPPRRTAGKGSRSSRRVDEEVSVVGGDGRHHSELVGPRGPLQHGVHVADVERHRAREGKRLAPLRGCRPHRRAPEPLALRLLLAARHHFAPAADSQTPARRQQWVGSRT